MREVTDVDPHCRNTLEEERGRRIFSWAKAMDDVGLPGAFEAYDYCLVAAAVWVGVGWELLWREGLF